MKQPLKATIWQAKDYRDQQIEGFLVTEPGDVDHPLAIVLAPRTRNRVDSVGVAYACAVEIAEVGADLPTGWVWREPFSTTRIIDLRYNETPAFIYGLLFRPMTNHKPSQTLEVPPVPCRRVCWDTLARLIEAAAKEASFYDEKEFRIPGMALGSVEEPGVFRCWTVLDQARTLRPLNSGERRDK